MKLIIKPQFRHDRDRTNNIALLEALADKLDQIEKAKTIENIIGREKWDAFLNKYFTEHAFQSMDTKHFLIYLDKELIKGDTALKQKINADGWIFAPGLPADCPVIKSAELDKAAKAAQDFKAGKNPSQLDTKNWTTHHWLYFLRNIGDTLSVEKMKMLDAEFRFTQSGNSEILCDWFQLSVKKHYEVAYPAMEKFLMSVGRRKFIVPIYKLMAADKTLKEKAKGIYADARGGYHAVAASTLDEVLN